MKYNWKGVKRKNKCQKKCEKKKQVSTLLLHNKLDQPTPGVVHVGRKNR